MGQPQLSTPQRRTYHPIKTLADLARHLQWALSIELSTIPPYLCALYSISDVAAPAGALLRSVAIEEMLHMMQVSNLLNSIGARPSLAPEFVPKYPSFIPHHAAGGPYVQLQALSSELVTTVFMPIEQPEASPHAPPEGEDFATLGQFYKAIEIGFENVVRELGQHGVFGRDTGFQRSDTYFGIGGGRLFVVHDLASAMLAITEITQQGEGSPYPRPPAPGEEPFGGYDHYGIRADGTYGPIMGVPWEMSHYRKFQQLANGSVPIPETFPMRPNPSGDDLGGEIGRLSELFDGSYTVVLQSLERAFTSDTAPVNFFGVAFALMQGVLPQVATLLMQTTLDPPADPALGPTAGPGFVYRPLPLVELVDLGKHLLTHPPDRGTAYMLLWEHNLALAVGALERAQEASEGSPPVPRPVARPLVAKRQSWGGRR